MPAPKMPAATEMGRLISNMAVLIGALKETDTIVRYAKAARYIGLLGPDEHWHPAHNRILSTILNFVYLIDKERGAERQFTDADFHRFHNQDGAPGVGAFRDIQITH